MDDWLNDAERRQSEPASQVDAPIRACTFSFLLGMKVLEAREREGRDE